MTTTKTFLTFNSGKAEFISYDTSTAQEEMMDPKGILEGWLSLKRGHELTENKVRDNCKQLSKSFRLLSARGQNYNPLFR